jgi:hypothetical protein
MYFLIPHPTALQIGGIKVEDIVRLSVYDYSGKCYMVKTELSYGAPIDISLIQSGLYFLVIQTRNDITSIKFVKY